MKNTQNKITIIGRSFKILLHRLRIIIAVLLGIKKPRMAKLMESVLFESRLLFLMIIIIIGFYAFNIVFEETTSEPNLLQIILKFNLTVTVVIMILMIRILFRLNSNYSHRCDLPNKFAPKCDKYLTYTKCEESKHDRD